MKRPPPYCGHIYLNNHGTDTARLNTVLLLYYLETVGQCELDLSRSA